MLAEASAVGLRLLSLLAGKHLWQRRREVVLGLPVQHTERAAAVFWWLIVRYMELATTFIHC
jgi:hypothetical protein